MDNTKCSVDQRAVFGREVCREQVYLEQDDSEYFDSGYAAVFTEGSPVQVWFLRSETEDWNAVVEVGTGRVLARGRERLFERGEKPVHASRDGSLLLVRGSFLSHERGQALRCSYRLVSTRTRACMASFSAPSSIDAAIEEDWLALAGESVFLLVKGQSYEFSLPGFYDARAVAWLPLQSENERTLLVGTTNGQLFSYTVTTGWISTTGALGALSSPMSVSRSALRASSRARSAGFSRLSASMQGPRPGGRTRAPRGASRASILAFLPPRLLLRHLR